MFFPAAETMGNTIQNCKVFSHSYMINITILVLKPRASFDRIRRVFMDGLLQQRIAADKAGKREEARRIFIADIKQNPGSERARGWMHSVCNTDQERIHCLKQVVRINPKNGKDQHMLDQLLA